MLMMWLCCMVRERQRERAKTYDADDRIEKKEEEEYSFT
jgi:hypothetical protein